MPLPPQTHAVALELRVLAGRQLSDLARYYENRRADGRPAPALDYGYALVLNRLGRNQEAADLLRPLAREPGPQGCRAPHCHCICRSAHARQPCAVASEINSPRL